MWGLSFCTLSSACGRMHSWCSVHFLVVSYDGIKGRPPLCYEYVSRALQRALTHSLIPCKGSVVWRAHKLLSHGCCWTPINYVAINLEKFPWWSLDRWNWSPLYVRAPSHTFTVSHRNSSLSSSCHSNWSLPSESYHNLIQCVFPLPVVPVLWRIKAFLGLCHFFPW